MIVGSHSKAVNVVSEAVPIGVASSDRMPSITDPGSGQAAVCDEVIVFFRPGSTLADMQGAIDTVGGVLIGTTDPTTWQVRIPCTGDFHGIQVAISTMLGVPVVDDAQANYVADLETVAAPNDQYFPDQWGLEKIKIRDAWEIRRTGPPVAVIDTGVDYLHEDIGGVILGRDFMGINDDDPMPDPQNLAGYHGTRVAGIIAARTNNNEVGVAGTVLTQIFATRVCCGSFYNWNQLGPTAGHIAAGIRDAVDRGIRILNLSLGTSTDARVIREAVLYAQERGAVLVAASGNENAETPMYPAAYAGVIAVGATSEADDRWNAGQSGSNFGEWVALYAPGTRIWSTNIGSTPYASGNGTSFAAPYVAGVVSLMRGVNAALTPAQILNTIRNTADDTGHDDPDGRRIRRLNAVAAVCAARAASAPCISACGCSRTPTPTNTPTRTQSATQTRTPTRTPTTPGTATNTPTRTPISTPTATLTNGASATPTNTRTSTKTATVTRTSTNTRTATSTTAPASTPTVAPRFIDNGNGTITDNQTGLMWEKKDDVGGIHDWDNAYSWSTGTSGNPDGTVFTSFLATLNTPPCFAGHCDWRLPTSAGCCGYPTGQAAELESILSAPLPCGTAPCVPVEFNTNCTPGCSVTSCSCTRSRYYWSRSTFISNPFYVWRVYFNAPGEVGAFGSTEYDAARAVRGGAPSQPTATATRTPTPGPSDTDGDGVPDASDSCAGTTAGQVVDSSGCACSQKTCNDGNACTNDSCDAGTAQCVFPPVARVCGDGCVSAGETCGEPGLANCPGGQTCSGATCTCQASGRGSRRCSSAVRCSSTGTARTSRCFRYGAETWWCNCWGCRTSCQVDLEIFIRIGWRS